MDIPAFSLPYERFCLKTCLLISKHCKNIKHMKMAPKVFLDKSVLYLDLAAETWQYNYEKHTQFEIIKKLSTTCAEYLLAESEIATNSSFEAMFKGGYSHLKILFSNMKKDRNYFLKECYRKFASIFFVKFEFLCHTQKRTKCRSLLRIHKILNIMDFHDNGLKSLLLAAICPDPDPELTVEILSVICRSEFMMLRFMLNFPVGALRAIFSIAKSKGFDFWGLWRGVGDMSTKYNLIAELMTSDGKLNAIILLQHGFPFLCSFDIYESMCTKFFYSRIRPKVYLTHDGYTRLLHKPNRARMMLILTTFLTIYENMEEVTRGDDTVATLGCLMRTLPNPYVLPSEMCNELKHYFTPASTDFIESVSRKYQECDVFPEEYTVYKPRKLKHLCRCVIRSVLATYWRLPEGIYQLGMPTQIIKYLSLEI